MQQGLIVCASSFEAVGNLPPCDLCQLYALINRIFTYAVGLLAAIAILMIIVGGFMYITAHGEEALLTKAKGTIRFAIIGFAIVVLSFVIVKSALAALGYPSGSANPFSTFSCGTPPPSGSTTATGGGASQTQLGPGAGGLGSSSVQQQFQQAGVNTVSGVGLEGMKQTTVKGITEFASASGCQVTVTGGTEGGHASGAYSHENGFKADLRKTSCVNSYIENSYTYVGNRGKDNARLYSDGKGNFYADEDDHWDVVYCYGTCTGGLKK